jgi:hypothetical protein
VKGAYAPFQCSYRLAFLQQRSSAGRFLKQGGLASLFSRGAPGTYHRPKFTADHVNSDGLWYNLDELYNLLAKYLLEAKRGNLALAPSGQAA